MLAFRCACILDVVKRGSGSWSGGTFLRSEVVPNGKPPPGPHVLSRRPPPPRRLEGCSPQPRVRSPGVCRLIAHGVSASRTAVQQMILRVAPSRHSGSTCRRGLRSAAYADEDDRMC